ncbi:MAG: hypothetical protein M1493_07855 [Firmicutes bacterium]|nr:hypothetical protein [Bacillota bacterium]
MPLVVGLRPVSVVIPTAHSLSPWHDRSGFRILAPRNDRLAPFSAPNPRVAYGETSNEWEPHTGWGTVLPQAGIEERTSEPGTGEAFQGDTGLNRVVRSPRRSLSVSIPATEAGQVIELTVSRQLLLKTGVV